MCRQMSSIFLPKQRQQSREYSPQSVRSPVENNEQYILKSDFTRVNMLLKSEYSVHDCLSKKYNFDFRSNELIPLWAKLRLQPMLQLALQFYLTIPQWKYGSYTPNAYILLYAFRCKKT